MSKCPFECKLFMHVIFETMPDQNIRIVGNLPQLGNWDPQKALQMSTLPNMYPKWFSLPIKVYKGYCTLFNQTLC